jgi:hypothetical protein
MDHSSTTQAKKKTKSNYVPTIANFDSFKSRFALEVETLNSSESNAKRQTKPNSRLVQPWMRSKSFIICIQNGIILFDNFKN